MDLRDLTTFKAVAAEGGITRAAERLNRVQSAITTRIKNLEQDLGRPLFIRDPGGMRLTPAGQVLLDYADRLTALAEEAENAVKDPRPRGNFRLGAMESTSAVRLPPIISAFLDDWPEVNLSLTTGNSVYLMSALEEGRIDAGFFAIDTLDPDRFDSIVAFTETPVLIHRRRQHDADAMLVFEEGCPHRRMLEQWYLTQDRRPPRVIELGGYHAVIGCVSAGMGTALVTQAILDHFPARDCLTETRLPPPFDKLEVRLVWRKGVNAPAVSVLRDMVAGA